MLLDVRGASPDELSASLGTLLPAVPAVELVHVGDDQLTELSARFPGRVSRAAAVRRTGSVLVTNGRVAYARGAVRRILADLRSPGRCVTRVLVPGLPHDLQVTAWAAGWLVDHPASPEELAGAGPDFDRAHLSAESPVVRAWVRADAVGVALVGTTGSDAAAWSTRVGLELGRDALLAAVRTPAGALRRRVSRGRQRRRHRQR